MQEVLDSAIATFVHRRHHLVTGNVIGPVGDDVPRPFWRVRLVHMHLGIYDRHREVSSIFTPGQISQTIIREILPLGAVAKSVGIKPE